jgi:hypothetical protein
MACIHQLSSTCPFHALARCHHPHSQPQLHILCPSHRLRGLGSISLGLESRSVEVLHLALLAVLSMSLAQRPLIRTTPGPWENNLPTPQLPCPQSSHPPHLHAPPPLVPCRMQCRLTSHLANRSSLSPLRSAAMRLSSLSERRTTRDATAM